MTYHPAVTQIRDLLTQHHLWYETFEHPPVLTSEEAAQLRDGYTLHQGAKALVIRIKDSASQRYLAMLVLPGDQKFNSEKVKRLFQAKNIRFATVAEIAEVTQGILPGGVPPFGQLFGLKVYADPTLLANEKIIFNAGDRTFSIAMKSADYQQVVKPIIAELI